MKNALKLFFLLFAVVAITSSCSKDDDPADNDFFVGTYNGRITYNGTDTEKSADNGSVRVVKVGNNYNFAFSDGIPNINGVEFNKDANTATSIGDETKLIRITASTLTIAYTKDGETWTANCSR